METQQSLFEPQAGQYDPNLALLLGEWVQSPLPDFEENLELAVNGPETGTCECECPGCDLDTYHCHNKDRGCYK